MRARQVGRQNTPVVFTPTTKIPSKVLSRCCSAVYKVSGSGKVLCINNKPVPVKFWQAASYHKARKQQPKIEQIYFSSRSDCQSDLLTSLSTILPPEQLPDRSPGSGPWVVPCLPASHNDPGRCSPASAPRRL